MLRSFACLIAVTVQLKVFLSSHRTPDLGYDWKSNSGRVFNYFCFGAACSEVEIDCLTGDHQVRPLLSRYRQAIILLSRRESRSRTIVQVISTISISSGNKISFGKAGILGSQL